MTNAVASDFRAVVAQRVEAAHQMLASRWLAQLKRLLPVAPDDIFPGEQLLGEIPALILELAAFFRAPAEEAIAANALVTARATELGQLRHAQRASVHQVLREYRALRAVIAQFIEEEWTDRATRDRVLATCERNVTRMSETLGKLVALVRAPEDANNALVQDSAYAVCPSSCSCTRGCPAASGVARTRSAKGPECRSILQPPD